MIDPDAAVRHALDDRTDIRQAKNSLEQNDISIRYLKNQLMPDINANIVYRGTGTGGSRYQTDIGAALEGRPPARLLVSERGYDTVIGDVFGASFPTWTFGIQVGYPIGQSAAGSEPRPRPAAAQPGGDTDQEPRARRDDAGA